MSSLVAPSAYQNFRAPSSVLTPLFTQSCISCHADITSRRAGASAHLWARQPILMTLSLILSVSYAVHMRHQTGSARLLFGASAASFALALISTISFNVPRQRRHWLCDAANPPPAYWKRLAIAGVFFKEYVHGCFSSASCPLFGSYDTVTECNQSRLTRRDGADRDQRTIHVFHGSNLTSRRHARSASGG